MFIYIGESQTNVEIMNEEDFNSLLRQEEEYIGIFLSCFIISIAHTCTIRMFFFL
jgi:hypothetical protein